MSSNYLKDKDDVKVKDYEYLKNIAKMLRNQKVRIEDEEPFSSPIFKVSIEKDEDKNFTFITREGAKRYIDVNSTTLKHLPQKDDSIDNEGKDEKRKINLFDVENNRNLEIERIIEIIKRNF